MNSKQLIEAAILHRQSRETSFIKRCSNASLTDIAAESGVSYPSLQNWKSGKNEPKYGDLLAVLNACGMDLNLTIKN